MPGESEPGEATVAAEQRQGPAGEVDHTWELSKENVMPLVRGRKVDCIRRAFGDSVSSDRREGDGGREEDEEAAGFAQGADAKTVLLAIRRRFEPLISDSAVDGEEEAGGGDGDKLAVWWQYIQAVQDGLPNDLQEQFELLERCSRRFLNDQRYRQDLRYLRVWTAYANYLSNADDLFKFLYDKGIGGTHAHFWIVWAMYAEKVGKFPLAERLYSKGIVDRRAKPIDVLEKRQKHFLRRMRRRWIDSQLEDGVEDVDEIPSDAEGRRSILQSLSAAAVKLNQRTKASGDSQVDENGQHNGGVTGAATNDQRRNLGSRGTGSRGGLSGGPSQSGGRGEATARRGGSRRGGRVRGGPNVGPGFAIFVEAEFVDGGSRRGDQGPLGDPEDDDGWADYGTRKSREKENVSDPTRWTEGGLGERPGASSSAAPHALTSGRVPGTAAPFPVYVDEQFANKEQEPPAAPREPEMTDRPVGSSGGPSLRRRLDRAGGEGESRAEVLARDPLHYVKTAEAAAARAGRARTKAQAAAGRKDAGGGGGEEDEEEQVEEARARWHAQRHAPAEDNDAGSTSRVVGGGDPSDDVRAIPDDQSAVASAAAVAVRPSAGVSAVPSSAGSSAGQSEGTAADVAPSPSSAGQSAGAGVNAGRSFAGQTGATVRDAVANASPKHASARGTIRQPLFGGENARGVDKAAAGSSSNVVGFDKTGACVLASASTGLSCRADASFVGPVNPREALHAGEIEGERHGDGGGEDVTWAEAGEDMGMQRRLTFGHGKVEAAARAAAATAAAADGGRAAPPDADAAAADAPAAAAASAANTVAGEGGSGQVTVEEQEEDDLTINTKLAMEAIEDWFCSPEPDKGRKKEASRESVAHDDGHGGGASIAGSTSISSREGGSGSSSSSSGRDGARGGGGDRRSNNLFGQEDLDDQENSARPLIVPPNTNRDPRTQNAGFGEVGAQHMEMADFGDGGSAIEAAAKSAQLSPGKCEDKKWNAHDSSETSGSQLRGGRGEANACGGRGQGERGGEGRGRELGESRGSGGEGRRGAAGRRGGGGGLKPLAEAPPPARITNADLLRGYGLASTMRKGQPVQSKEKVKEKEEEEEVEVEVLPLPSGLGFAVYNDHGAAPGGGGGGGGGEKGGLPLSNGLSFAVYQDSHDVGEAHGCKDGVDKRGTGDGASVFANGLSFSVYVDDDDGDDDDDDDDDATPGVEGGGGVHEGRLPISNGLGFSVYQDEDAAAGDNDGNTGGDGKGGAGDGLAFSNELGFAVFRDGDNDQEAATAVGSSSSAPHATSAPSSAGGSASSSASRGLGITVQGDKGGVVGGGGDHAPSAGKPLSSESGRTSSGRGGGGGGGVGYGRDGLGARGGDRRDQSDCGGGDGGGGVDGRWSDGGDGGTGGGRTTASVGGEESPVVRQPRGADALPETGDSGLRKLEVSFFEDPIFGDAESGDGSEDTAGGLSVLRFFDDSTVDSPLFEPAVDSRVGATGPSRKSGVYKRAGSATSATSTVASSSGTLSASSGFGSSSGSATGRSASSARDNGRVSLISAAATGTAGTSETSGTVGFSTGRKSLAREAGGPNRLELSPVHEGGVNGGALATSQVSSTAAEGPVSAGLGFAAARQVPLPPKTPHAATARVGSAAASAAGAAGASATSTAAGAAAAVVGGGSGVVYTAVGGVAMETPRSGPAGPRVRGGVRGQGHGEVDDSWSEDDANHSGGSGGVGGGRGRGHRIGLPNGSWGGCSTIKRRADEMVDHTHGVSTGYGGRGIGLAHRGGADDDGNSLTRGFPNRSRMSSSSTASSLSLGGDFFARSSGGGGDGGSSLGVKQTPHAGSVWRTGGSAGGGGGDDARESYGRGGGVGRAGGGGGRVDYHSLCFSSSSSGYSASSSSPFGLLDRDSSNSET